MQDSSLHTKSMADKMQTISEKDKASLKSPGGSPWSLNSPGGSPLWKPVQIIDGLRAQMAAQHQTHEQGAQQMRVQMEEAAKTHQQRDEQTANAHRSEVEVMGTRITASAEELTKVRGECASMRHRYENEKCKLQRLLHGDHSTFSPQTHFLPQTPFPHSTKRTPQPQPMSLWSLLESESTMFSQLCEKTQVELQSAISSALRSDSLTKQEIYDKHIPLLFAAHSFQTKQLRMQYFGKVAMMVSNPKAYIVSRSSSVVSVHASHVIPQISATQKELALTRQLLLKILPSLKNVYPIEEMAGALRLKPQLLLNWLHIKGQQPAMVRQRGECNDERLSMLDLREMLSGIKLKLCMLESNPAQSQLIDHLLSHFGEMDAALAMHENRSCSENTPLNVMSMSRMSRMTMQSSAEKVGGGAFACLLCEKSFATRPSLKQHITKVHSSDERPYYGGPFLCGYGECGRAFKSRNLLFYHIRHDHDGAPWECLHCDRKFKRKTDLTRHCHAAHSEMRNQPTTVTHSCPPIKRSRAPSMTKTCEICRKTFHSIKGYADHKLLHTNERPFACVHCPGKFVTEARLAQHVLNVHKMDPYECTKCKMSFKRKTDWRNHKCAEQTENSIEREESEESRGSDAPQPRNRSSKRTKSLF